MIEILFASPSVEAVTGWDLSDGAWLHAPSGLIRIDNTVKPSYLMLKDHVKRIWSTDVTLTSDADGYVDLSGFRGTYEASADGRAAELVLSKDTKDISIIL